MHTSLRDICMVVCESLQKNVKCKCGRSRDHESDGWLEFVI